MNKRTNQLDELQEQKLLRIEHHAAWFAFWGLLASIIIQTIMSGDDSLRTIAGEWIVFMCLALYMGIACIRSGIWDRTLRPNAKTNLLVSSISAAVFGMIFFASSFIKYQKFVGSICTGIIMFISIFVLTFVALTICASVYKKRAAKLEQEIEE